MTPRAKYSLEGGWQAETLYLFTLSGIGAHGWPSSLIEST